MSNVTDSSTIDLINNISAQINRYITLFVLLFGTIGNLLNTLVLSQPSLRSNPCVLYFLGSSISSLGIMLVGLPTRFIGVWISTDPTNTNAFLCKSRIFLLYGFRTTSVWLIVFATVDRWFVSSFRVTRRFLSSRRIAHKSIFIIHILSFLLWSQTLYCYNTDRIQAPLTCYGMSPICRIFNDVTYAITTVLIPSVLMLIFGFLTIHNINRSQRAVVPFMGTIHGINIRATIHLCFIRHRYLTNFLKPNKMTDRKAVIKNADMSEDMQQDAVDIATQALEKYNIEKDIAAYIKKEFDKKYNPTWHCIVGRNFGSYVTHETKHFIYFYLGQVAILLFKSG
ncbi:unnamed protein product [Rotaria magnacalcarata]|uniref:G-protein coupled receptors family 1 profile domain-containing protein n=1 Tax=Rotaria magnacalcarata TaxID=392030 RepID=A0A814P3X9_9BILA|nr:unnamed protein product [Rotaria magnacalcarata]